MSECIKCNVNYIKTAPAQKYCEDCKDIRKIEHRIANREAAARRRRKAGCKVGQGAPRGEAHPNFKHGRYTYETIRGEIKAEIRYCEKCSKDLLKATQGQWVVHHIDHDQYHYQRENLQLLCARCHLIEHDCISHLKQQKGSETIRKE